LLLYDCLQVTERVGLAGATTAVENLMIDRFERGGDSRVDKGVSELLCLPRLCSFGHDVQGSVYGRKASRRHRWRILNPISHLGAATTALTWTSPCATRVLQSHDRSRKQGSLTGC
jgi:hypothetical protein